MMKKISAILLMTLALCFSVSAQVSTKKPALPSNLAKYVDEYPDKLMKVAAVKTRLKTLLGKKYLTFESYISVQSPMTQVGDFLFASGCLAHSCTISEAAFAIDLKNKRIYTFIYDKGKEPKFYHEDKAETPQILLDRIKELKAM